MNLRIFTTLACIFVSTAVTSCTLLGPRNPEPIEDPVLSIIQTAVIESLTPHPTDTLPTSTVQPVETGVNPTAVTLKADVSADTLNLRAGPSMLHNILSQYKKGDQVTILARAPGDEWLKVIGKDNRIGWMYVGHLTLIEDFHLLPIAQINESLVATGRVVDASGKGIPGIQVALTRTGGAQRVRITGISMDDGVFYAFAPVEYQGTWLATVIGVGCGSRIVDSNCRYAGVFYPVEGIDLTLPTFDELLITYK